MNLTEECPELDADRDGLANGLDACPQVVGLAELKGCPDRDLDGDGVGTGGGSGEGSEASGNICSCTVTLSGVTKTSNTCSETLCFGTDAYVCNESGARAASSGRSR